MPSVAGLCPGVAMEKDCGPDEEVFDEGVGCTSSVETILICVVGALALAMVLAVAVTVRRRLLLARQKIA